jgi:N-acetyldiaminopimelate deacetylase
MRPFTLALACVLVTPALVSADDWFAGQEPGLLDLYRHLHSHPELSYHEAETSKRIAEELRRVGAEVTTGVGKFGVVGVLKNGEGPVLLVRTDLDALPVTEQTGLPFASKATTTDDEGKAVGVMHACGHDVHMTCGLGILERSLARPQRNSLVFLFQPAEENISGAQQICDAGLLDKYPISEFYALHVSPEWDAGVIATRPGTLLAGSSSVTVEFTGVAGHAGMPHRAVDPIVSVASFVLQIQAMIARNFDPAVGGVVLTFGTISGGTVVNGVAASAKVMGTLRFLDSAQHDLAFKRVSEVARGVALATGATAGVRLEDSPWVPVRNDHQITARFTDYMRNRTGVAFEDAPVTMASEDYGYLINRIPGMMFWLGVGRRHPLHSGKFSADEKAIEPTVRLISDYLTQL